MNTRNSFVACETLPSNNKLSLKNGGRKNYSEEERSRMTGSLPPMLKWNRKGTPMAKIFLLACKNSLNPERLSPKRKLRHTSNSLLPQSDQLQECQNSRSKRPNDLAFFSCFRRKVLENVKRPTKLRLKRSKHLAQKERRRRSLVRPQHCQTKRYGVFSVTTMATKQSRVPYPPDLSPRKETSKRPSERCLPVSQSQKRLEHVRTYLFWMKRRGLSIHQQGRTGKENGR